MRKIRNLLASMSLLTVFVIGTVFGVGGMMAFAGEESAGDISEHTFFIPNYNAETSLYGSRVAEFAAYLEEHSGGLITCEINWNASFCKAAEELDYVIDGAADMCFCPSNPVAQKIPFFGMEFEGDGYQESLESARYLLVENEITSEIVQNACASNGFYVMPGFGVGGSWFFGNKEVKSWQDLIDSNYGSERIIAVYDALGMHYQQMATADIYESLSRGVIDTSSSSLANLLSNRFYEVAPYILTGITGNTNCQLCINLDLWNSLTPDEQALIKEANDYSIDVATKATAEQKQEAVSTLENEGCTVNFFSEEDIEMYSSLNEQCNYDQYKAVAASLGLEEEFEAYIDEWQAYTGIELVR